MSLSKCQLSKTRYQNRNNIWITVIEQIFTYYGIIKAGGDSVNEIEAISFKKVNKYYNDFHALKDISFNIPRNSIVGLIGSNGSGKTTMIKCLLNYYNDYSGEITIFGEKNNSIIQENSPFAYIPDTAVYYEELTVDEHLDFISRMYKTEEKVEKLIKDFQLESHLNKFPHELSRGNQQKLLICCALLRDYKLLVADEPFSGLDPRQLNNLRERFLELKDEGKTIILSTHLLALIENLCDYYIMIDKGKLIGVGTIQEILAKTPDCKSLEDLYLHLSKDGEENDE